MVLEQLFKWSLQPVASWLQSGFIQIYWMEKAVCPFLSHGLILQMERSYDQVDQEYDSDMDGSGSLGSEDRSPQAHLNGSYMSTYAEDDLSPAEWSTCTHNAKYSDDVSGEHSIMYHTVTTVSLFKVLSLASIAVWL